MTDRQVSEQRSEYVRDALAFLDRQMLNSPSVNDQVGFDFQGLRQSFQEDPAHPDSKQVAQFGRIWIYDVALSIYADLKADRIRQAGYQAGRVMQLALREEELGYRGMWHFSYNTRGDAFIDARGPTGANTWCLNAIYAYLLQRPEGSLLQWANRKVAEYLFPRQVMDPQDPRHGLIRAGLYNADEMARGEAMGYRVYRGDLNRDYQHVILEHCADAAATFRLAFRVNQRLPLPDRGFLEELVRRHDRLLQGMRRCFWQKDHFVSALDESGAVYRGTDGLPSVAVDNNTWSAHVFAPYDMELARSAIKFVEDRFVLEAPPASVEDTTRAADARGLKGVFYFLANFSDPFVQMPEDVRPKMETIFQMEAAFGFALFLLGASACTTDPEEKNRLREKAEEMHQHTLGLLRLYGPSGAPYASANVPAIFSTLHSVTTAATGVVATAILEGAPGDDFIGVVPPPEFTVAGKKPLLSA
ncbi:MAG: hypothetical protein HYZ94_00560 [Candidatus Omnitrophica bacterium]|nr:hypothetical protein [Candidatus Omnitrophota bacterium]